MYMVVERFKNGDAVMVYRRFRNNGRTAPEGNLLDEWMSHWSDLVT
jgi:hypothetical protein